MNKKRLPRLLICAGLTASVMLTVPALAFSDTEAHWAEPAISKWSEEYHIINGYEDGTFRPDASITRGAFAGIMDRFMKYQEQAPAGTFSDLAGNYWEEAILKLNASGVYLGNGGKALAGDTITRQQAVTMIARAFRVEPSVTLLPYEDADSIAEVFRPAVAEMTARGYITDCADGRFRPAEPITRAEIVNILNHMVDVLLQETQIYRKNVPGTLMINAAEGMALEDMTIDGDLIIAPGVVGGVSMRNVTLKGQVQNFSGVEIDHAEPKPEPKPEPEQKPEDKPAQPADPAAYPWVEPDGYMNYYNDKIPLYDSVDRSLLADGDFVWKGEEGRERLVYRGNEFDTRFGIDVSYAQGDNIDWEAVADDGVDFAFVRVGFRGYGAEGTLNTDKYYERNIDGAMAAGIDTGVYFFSQAITVEEAIEEADLVISLLEGHEISGPVAYDWEMHNSSYRVYGTDPKVATACALAFCQRIEEAGYQPMIYMSRYVGYNKMNLPQLTDYPIWTPEYKYPKTAAQKEQEQQDGEEKPENLFPKFYYQMDIWQYTDRCHVNGIQGRVDANIQFIP